MADTEQEASYKKDIAALQSQVNSLNAYTQRVHRVATRPSTTSRIDSAISSVSDKFTDWVDYGTTATIVGWSAYTVKTILYKLIDDVVYVEYDISGTSNSVNTMFTLPYSADATVLRWVSFNVHCTDNSVLLTYPGLVEVNSNYATFYTSGVYNTWTAGGTKIIRGQFFYRAV